MKRFSIITVAIFVALAGCGPDTPEERQARNCDQKGAVMASIMVQDAVRTRLKSPSTAEFPFNEAKSIYSGDCKFVVMGPVDAQNGFGAMIRSQYVASIRYDPTDDTWQTLSADVIE